MDKKLKDWNGVPASKGDAKMYVWFLVIFQGLLAIALMFNN